MATPTTTQIAYSLNYMIFNAIERDLQRYQHHQTQLKHGCSIVYEGQGCKKVCAKQLIPAAISPNKNIGIEHRSNGMEALKLRTSKRSRSSQEKKKLFDKSLTLSRSKIRPDLASPRQTRPNQTISISKYHRNPSKSNNLRQMSPISHSANPRSALQAQNLQSSGRHIDEQIKQQSNDMSRAAVTSGCELYELSPIHFSKYMHFIDASMPKLPKLQGAIQSNNSDMIVVESRQIAQYTFHHDVDHSEVSPVVTAALLQQPPAIEKNPTSKIIHKLWPYILLASGSLILSAQILK